MDDFTEVPLVSKKSFILTIILAACGIVGGVLIAVNFPDGEVIDAYSASSEAKISTKPPPQFLTFNLEGGVTMEFVLIPSGSFLMGSPTTEIGRFDNEEQHAVVIHQQFYMGIYTITQKQFQAIMGTNPSEVKESDSHPVTNVSWGRAVEFCRKLSRRTRRKVRLPTEAEWEYACRAGTTTAFNTGDTLDVSHANYESKYASYINRRASIFPERVYHSSTTPAGKFPPNAWGLYDMHGNVWEWCADWYSGRHGIVDTVNSPAPWVANNRYVLRGGSWYHNMRACRSAGRAKATDNESEASRVIGFRVVVECL